MGIISADGSRATAAVYSIAHELGTSDVTVNQRANGDQWVLLGTYDFDPAVADAEVTLDGFSDGTVAADAIRFVEAGVAPTEVAYLHNDQLGRPQKMTDSAGLITSDRTQRPFGETVTDSGLDSTPIRFPGQYADAETGLHYNYFRDYDPSLGRYITSDPIGLDGGINTYGYTHANPQSFIDPDGTVAYAVGAAIRACASRGGCWGFAGAGAYAICRLAGGCKLPSDAPEYCPTPLFNEEAQPDPMDAADAPGQPSEKDGYKAPKNWDGKKVKNPNGPGSGWPDKNGNVWVPTGPKGSSKAHGGPHWDVQSKGGGYKNVYPGGKVRGGKP
ncbi:MAG: RHS repeat-associated core domain-containing protein [Pseudomonadota bacterium]